MHLFISSDLNTLAENLHSSGVPIKIFWTTEKKVQHLTKRTEYPFNGDGNNSYGPTPL